jgi:hypothetical protein
MMLWILWRLEDTNFSATDIVVPLFGRKNVATLTVMVSFTMV